MTSIHVRRLQWLKANTKRRFIELAAANPGVPFHEIVEMQLPWFALRGQDGQPAQPGERYESVDVLIYDEIGGSFGVDAGAFAEQIGALDTPLLRVRINSPGGSVFDAKAIHSSLLHHPARVQTYVDGLAASAASIVLLAGDEIVVMPGGEIMVHDASMHEAGNPADHAAASAFLERECQSLAEMYAERTGGDIETWRELMRAETWMYGREAIELRIADRLEGYPNRRDPELARSFDMSGYRYAGRAAAPAPARRLVTGQPLASRGVGLPGRLSVAGKAIAVHHTATVDTAWDGPAEVAAAPAQADTLDYMHAWVDSAGNPDAKGSYKFPHHAAGTDTPANLAGVRNALARLAQADIPEGDRAGVQRHLQAHMDDGEGNEGDDQGGGDADDLLNRHPVYTNERTAALVGEVMMGRQSDVSGYVIAQARGDGMMREAHRRAQQGRKVPVLDTSDLFRQQLRVVRSELPKIGQERDAARLATFPGRLQRAGTQKINKRDLTHVAGYATVFGRQYDMWDEYGPYLEDVAAGAADWTLAQSPDTAFLMNHRGITMARTKAPQGMDPTLLLGADGTGMSDDAFVNEERDDVRRMMIAIDDGQITEQSFAFMIEEGGWNDEFTAFTIKRFNIDRGDVSAVNFGANPYTSIGARSQQLMSDLAALPPAMARAAFARLARRADLAGMINDALMPAADEFTRSSGPRVVDVEAAAVSHLVGAPLASAATAVEDPPLGRRITLIEAEEDL